MSKKEIYSQLPTLLKRLFTWGFLAASAFLIIWYNGGINLYGFFLAPIVDVLIPLADVAYEKGTVGSAKFIYKVEFNGINARELTFIANQLNSSALEVITLLAMWPKTSLKKTAQLSIWCFLFLILYHSFQIFIQCYSYQIGPEMANSLNTFWEPSLWWDIVKNISKFDLFILRFWAGFPVFGLALFFNSALTPMFLGWLMQIRKKSGVKR